MAFRDNDDVQRSRLSRDAKNFAERHGVDRLNRALGDATFNRGPLAGRTGDPFKDDKFFNPWRPGEHFNKGR